jgi:hypothetical protein
MKNKKKNAFLMYAQYDTPNGSRAERFKPGRSRASGDCFGKPEIKTRAYTGLTDLTDLILLTIGKKVCGWSANQAGANQPHQPELSLKG